jgi:hypothetical protein
MKIWENRRPQHRAMRSKLLLASPRKINGSAHKIDWSTRNPPYINSPQRVSPHEYPLYMTPNHRKISLTCLFAGFDSSRACEHVRGFPHEATHIQIASSATSSAYRDLISGWAQQNEWHPSVIWRIRCRGIMVATATVMPSCWRILKMINLKCVFQQCGWVLSYSCKSLNGIEHRMSWMALAYNMLSHSYTLNPYLIYTRASLQSSAHIIRQALYKITLYLRLKSVPNSISLPCRPEDIQISFIQLQQRVTYGEHGSNQNSLYPQLQYQTHSPRQFTYLCQYWLW